MSAAWCVAWLPTAACLRYCFNGTGLLTQSHGYGTCQIASSRTTLLLVKDGVVSQSSCVCGFGRPYCRNKWFGTTHNIPFAFFIVNSILVRTKNFIYMHSWTSCLHTLPVCVASS